MPNPIILTPADLPTPADLALTHWSLSLMLRGGRTIEEARVVEAKRWAVVRGSFEGEEGSEC